MDIELSQITETDLEVLSGGGNTLLYDYLMTQVTNQYQERLKDFKASLQSPDKLIARQNRLKESLQELLEPFPEKTPLNARVTGIIECDGYRIEKVYFESFPNHHVTANLYIPTTGGGPYPGVMIPCGHTDKGKAYEMYQTISVLMALNGLVALCYDPICQGERIQLPDSPRYGTTTHTLLNVGAVLVGRTVGWYEMWNGIRAIDYVLSRPEVDGAKPVGMTGTSGGGTRTTFLMVFDDRVGPAAISSYIQTRERKFQRRSFVGNDGCQQFPSEGAYQIDHADYIIARAPKPTIVLAATQDHHDIKATRFAASEAKQVYEALGKAEYFEFFESDTPHGFTVSHREAAVRWMRKWLLDDDSPVVEPDIELQTEHALWVTHEGQVLKSFKDERTVSEMNLERAKELAKARKHFRETHSTDQCLQKIKNLIGLANSLPKVTQKNIGTIQLEGLIVEKLIIECENQMPVAALVFIPSGITEPAPATLYVDGNGKTGGANGSGVLEKLIRQGRIVLSIDARGFGETTDDQSKVPEKFCNTEYRTALIAMHIGRPLPGQRVRDILTALDVLVSRNNVDASRIDLVAVGRTGPVALHAAAIDNRFTSVALHDSIHSWVDDVLAKPLQHDLIGHVVPSGLIWYDLEDLLRIIGPEHVRIH